MKPGFDSVQHPPTIVLLLAFEEAQQTRWDDGLPAIPQLPAVPF
jgi:hypothetical protein